nr:P7 protein [Carrot reovirus 1]
MSLYTSSWVSSNSFKITTITYIIPLTEFQLKTCFVPGPTYGFSILVNVDDWHNSLTNATSLFFAVSDNPGSDVLFKLLIERAAVIVVDDKLVGSFHSKMTGLQSPKFPVIKLSDADYDVLFAKLQDLIEGLSCSDLIHSEVYKEYLPRIFTSINEVDDAFPPYKCTIPESTNQDPSNKQIPVSVSSPVLEVDDSEPTVEPETPVQHLIDENTNMGRLVESADVFNIHPLPPAENKEIPSIEQAGEEGSPTPVNTPRGQSDHMSIVDFRDGETDAPNADNEASLRQYFKVPIDRETLSDCDSNPKLRSERAELDIGLITSKILVIFGASCVFSDSQEIHSDDEVEEFIVNGTTIQNSILIHAANGVKLEVQETNVMGEERSSRVHKVRRIRGELRACFNTVMEEYARGSVTISPKASRMMRTFGSTISNLLQMYAKDGARATIEQIDDMLGEGIVGIDQTIIIAFPICQVSEQELRDQITESEDSIASHDGRTIFTIGLWSMLQSTEVYQSCPLWPPALAFQTEMNMVLGTFLERTSHSSNQWKLSDVQIFVKGLILSFKKFEE